MQFVHPQMAGERKLFHSVSRNPWEVIISGPVCVAACVMMELVAGIPFSSLHHSTTTKRFLELKAVARLGGPLGRGAGHQQERSALLAGILLKQKQENWKKKWLMRYFHGGRASNTLCKCHILFGCVSDLLSAGPESAGQGKTLKNSPYL